MRQNDFINRKTDTFNLLFVNSKTGVGGLSKVSFSAQKVVDSEDGHYLGTNEELISDIYKTEYCFVSSKFDKNGIPIVFKEPKEIESKLNLDNLYVLNFDFHEELEFKLNGELFIGTYFDLLIHLKGIDSVIDMFDINNSNPKVIFKNILNELNDIFEKYKKIFK